MSAKAASKSTSRSRVRAVVAALFLLVLPGAPGIGVASAEEDPSCPDVEVVFARGTFEAPGVGDTGQAFVDALNARLPGRNVAVYPVDYPASLDFQAAADGIEDASTKVESISAACPATEIVVGGYSQGAAVAGYITADGVPEGFTLPAGIRGPMPVSVAPHVAAVVLFGTPDNWFLNLVDREAPPITIGSLYSAKTIELCAPGDPVCSPGGLDRSAHSSYRSNGMPDQAADFTVNALAQHPSTQSA